MVGTANWYQLTCTRNVSKFMFKAENNFTVVHFHRNQMQTTFNRSRIDLSSAFRHLTAIKSLKITTRVGGILNFSYMFIGNTSIEYVEFAYLHFGQTKDFRSAFSGCTNLKYVSHFNTQRGYQTHTGFSRQDIFKGCTSLIRPSSREVDLLERGWGGICAYNIDAPYVRAKKYNDFKIEIIKTKIMDTHTKISSWWILDEFGVWVQTNNLVASTEYSSAYSVDKITDNDYRTSWIANGPLPQYMTFKMQFPMILSSIRFQVDGTRPDRGPEQVVIYGKNPSGQWEAIGRPISSSTLLGHEEVSFIITI